MDPQQAAYGICQPKITPVFLYSSSLDSFPHSDKELVSACLMVWQCSVATPSPFTIIHTYMHMWTNMPRFAAKSPSVNTDIHTVWIWFTFFFCHNSLIVQLHITRASMSSFKHGQAKSISIGSIFRYYVGLCQKEFAHVLRQTGIFSSVVIYFVYNSSQIWLARWCDIFSPTALGFFTVCIMPFMFVPDRLSICAFVVGMFFLQVTSSHQ